MDLTQIITGASPSVVTALVCLHWLRSTHTESIRREREYAETILNVYVQLVKAQTDIAERSAVLTADVAMLGREIHSLKNAIQTHVLDQALDGRDRRKQRGADNE